MRIRKMGWFDERYLFNFSAAVWYVVIGVSALAIAGSALVFFWGVVPAFKHRVPKPHYPAPVAVSLDELQTEGHGPAGSTVKTSGQAPTAGAAEYAATLERIKELIPPSRYPWRSTGHWEQTWYQKRWVIDRVGTLDSLNAAFKRVGASSFVDKKQLLDGYIPTLILLPEKTRMRALTALLRCTRNSLAKSLSIIGLLHDSVKQFSTDRTDYLAMLATFSAKNPRDGEVFIEYVNKTIGKFDPRIRVDALRSLIAAYYKHFNDVSRQVEATDLFLPLLPKIGPEEQARTLTKYYDVYVKKNAARGRTISELNAQYAKKKALAEATYEARKLHKASYRVTGVLGVLSGIGAIALIALMLVLLAIQRGVRRIEVSHVHEEQQR